MSLSWTALREQLLRLVDHHHHHQRFLTLRARQPDLARFGDIGALIDFQHRTDENFVQRNAVLRALIAEAQRLGGAAETARLVLMLALWPGLDAIHRRLLRYYRHDSDALAADLAGGISTGIARLNLDRVTWAAATLVRNLERDLHRRLAGDLRHPVHAALDHEHGAEDDRELAMWLTCHDLERLIADDAGIVIAVVLSNERQAEVAARLGITPDALRKRYQRALVRLRAALEQ